MEFRRPHCDRVSNEQLNTDEYTEITTRSDVESLNVGDPIYATNPSSEYSECVSYNGRVEENPDGTIIIHTYDYDYGVDGFIFIKHPLTLNLVKYYKRAEVEPKGGKKKKRKTRSKRRKSKRRKTRRRR